MTHDNAHFRQKDLEAVWTGYPCCVLTVQHSPVDFHHVLGRGYVFGSPKKSDDRKIFSSVLNAVPLHRLVHDGPMRDSPEMRLLFLRIARQHVMNAIAQGNYELSDADRDFMAFADTWRQEALPTL